ncbi:uncharacterized protein [Diabrotica undecimpunctata]|uniref:uncharacterized protein n=1 Tax=Diabrotica undecimpunctata TaxID=50387 RepID=UPI003B63C187
METKKQKYETEYLKYLMDIKEEENEDGQANQEVNTLRVKPATTSIVSCRTQNKSKQSKPISKPKIATPDEIENQIDIESIKGRFGWALIEDSYLPYIMRRDGHYFCLKIITKVIFGNYTVLYETEILSCVKHIFDLTFATKAEILNFNNINAFHCDHQYAKGLLIASPPGILIHQDHVKEFGQYIKWCFKIIYTYVQDASVRAGYVLINGAYVSYVVVDGLKYVPTFYFEMDPKSFEKCEKIELKNWDLAYIKFCGLIQGVAAKYTAGTSCFCFALDKVKEYFSQDTVIYECNPVRLVNVCMLLQQSTATNLAINSLYDFNIKTSKTVTATNPPPLQPLYAINSSQRHAEQQTTADNNIAMSPTSNIGCSNIVKISIRDKVLLAISLDLQNNQDAYVTLQDLVLNFFCSNSVDKLKSVLMHLGIKIDEATPYQTALLRSFGCNHHRETLLLVHQNTFQRFWPQIVYMMGN